MKHEPRVFDRSFWAFATAYMDGVMVWGALSAGWLGLWRYVALFALTLVALVVHDYLIDRIKEDARR